MPIITPRGGAERSTRVHVPRTPGHCSCGPIHHTNKYRMNGYIPGQYQPNEAITFFIDKIGTESAVCYFITKWIYITQWVYYYKMGNNSSVIVELWSASSRNRMISVSLCRHAWHVSTSYEINTVVVAFGYTFNNPYKGRRRRHTALTQNMSTCSNYGLLCHYCLRNPEHQS